MTTITTDMTVPRMTFGAAKKAIAEMNLINGFLFDSTLENEEDAKVIVGGILKAIFDREFNEIKIDSQKPLQSIDTKYHGIRFDAHITEDQETNVLAATIYDIEMEDRAADKKELPKRLRYYGAMHDVKLLESSTPYEKLPDFITITISSYDPFDLGSMYYEAKTTLISHPNIEYNDGITHLFFYCNGKANPGSMRRLIKSPAHSKKLQEMLKYIVSGEIPSTVNPDITEMNKIVTKTKSKKEVTIEYMRQIDREYSIKREAELEAKKISALIMIEFGRENNIPDSATRDKIKRLGLDSEIIDSLFQQVDESDKLTV